MSQQNLSLGFPTRSDTNRAVQPQKMARDLKFQIQEVEGLYYLCSENKGAEQLRGLFFAYAKSRFSHDAAHLKLWHLSCCLASQNNPSHKT